MRNAIFILVLSVIAFLVVAPAFADVDNNPPGPAGGAGTNWENPPGPEGGPGASPDVKTGDAAVVDTVWEEKADKDDDGIVEPAEAHRWKEMHSESIEERAEVDTRWEEKADKDDDGVVEPGEAYKWKETHQKREAIVDSAWEEKADKDDDGIVEKGEIHRWKSTHPRKDNDDNPPGPKGGAGTNWENPPGPKGGAGASPNRRR